MSAWTSPVMACRSRDSSVASASPERVGRPVVVRGGPADAVPGDAIAPILPDRTGSPHFPRLSAGDILAEPRGAAAMSFFERVDSAIRRSIAWRSLFRSPYPNDERSRAIGVMNNVFLHLHPVRVRQHAVRFAYTFCLGGLSFFLFLVLTVTGVYLMFFYVPSATLAYTNILEIQSQVTFGLLTRNVHRWGAHLMVFLDRKSV